jgi:hypothetical protein
LRTLIHNQIRAAASPGLGATLDTSNWFTALQMDRPASAIPYQVEFTNRLRLARPGFPDAQLRQCIWRELAYRVSAYIEFAPSTDTSRLVYNVVNSRVYVSAQVPQGLQSVVRAYRDSNRPE